MLIPLEQIFNPYNVDAIDNYQSFEQHGVMSLGQINQRFGYTRFSFDHAGNQILPIAGKVYITENGCVLEQRSTRIGSTDMHMPYWTLYRAIRGRLFEVSITPETADVIDMLKYADPRFSDRVSNSEYLKCYLRAVEQRDWDIGPMEELAECKGTPPGEQIDLNMGSRNAREKSSWGIHQHSPQPLEGYLRIAYVTLATFKYITGDFKSVFVVRKRSQSVMPPELMTFADICKMIEAKQSFEIYSGEYKTLFVIVEELTSDLFDGLPCFVDERLSELNEKAFINKTVNFGLPVVDLSKTSEEVSNCGSNLAYRVRSILEPEEVLARYLGLSTMSKPEGDVNYINSKMFELEQMINVGDAIREKGVTDDRR